MAVLALKCLILAAAVELLCFLYSAHSAEDCIRYQAEAAQFGTKEDTFLPL